MSETEPVLDLQPLTETEPVPNATPPLEYVGFRRRAGARIIDMALHYGIGAMAGFVFALLAYIVQGATGRPAAPLLATLGQGPLAFISALLGATLFDALMEGFHGSTFGKQILGIVVLDEAVRPCSFKAATIRSFAFFFDGILFGLVAESSMRQSPMQQRHGDKWAHTIVVRRRSVPEASLRSPFRFGLTLVIACFADGFLIVLQPLLQLFS